MKKTEVIVVPCDQEHNNTLPETLQLTWAVVLGTYTASDYVSFDLGCNIDDSAAGKAETLFTPKHLTLSAEDTISSSLQTINQSISNGNTDRAKVLLLINENGRTDNATQRTASQQVNGDKYNLSILCNLHDESASMLAFFDNAVWASETVYMMLYQVRHAMNLMASSCAVTVDDLRGICPEGLKQLAQWNPQGPPAKSSTPVWALFEKAFRAHALDLAIDSWDGRLTYSQLEQRAIAFATFLIQQGLGPDKFVGLFLEKSMITTVAILGIIKSGCAFILLDPAQPKQRLQAMCMMTEPTLIVASPAIVQAAADLGFPVCSTADIPSTPPAELAAVTGEPSNILYVGFTSGSTGQPKGIVVEYATFATGFLEYSSQLGLNTLSRAFQFLSYSFQMTISTQLAALVSGACLCVPSQHELENDLPGAMRSLEANWVVLTPSVARTLNPEEVPGLLTVFLVGESISRAELQKWQRRDLYSCYGQTEYSKALMITRKTVDGNPRNIGHPYFSVCWLVDPKNHDRLAPVGAEGELIVEGPALCRGYLGNAEADNQAFIMNPAWLTEAGRTGETRCLKTGDLARINPVDGSFELLGRKGTMAKLRGQRIELGEVEHQIQQLLCSSQTVVAEIISPSDDVDGQLPMLVAFILLYPNSSTDHIESCIAPRPTAEFRELASGATAKLEKILPSYMIPAAYVEISTLPRTTSWKINRGKLRECASRLTRQEILEYSVARTTHRKPETRQEVILQDLCEQILHLPHGQVGMNDTFLNLGGDSLTARHLVLLARSQGLVILLKHLLQQSSLATVAQLASTVKDESPHPEDSSDYFSDVRDGFMAELPPGLEKEAVEDVFPTLELQGAYAASQVVDCFQFHLSGSLDTTQLQHACESLVQQHGILRTSFHYFRGQLVQVMLKNFQVPFDVQDCENINEASQWAKSFGEVELEKQHAIDQPVTKFALVRALRDQQHILILRISHGQHDALSWRPLVQDLWAAYQNEPFALRPKFKTHVQRCFARRNPEAYAVWRKILAGAPPPQLRFEPDVLDDQEPRLVAYQRELPTVTPKTGTTRATMVKAAWFEALRGETGQNDLVFGQFLSGWTGTEAVVGPCINLVPVRVNLQSNWTRRQLLETIQSQHAQMISYDTICWEDIVSNCTDWPTNAKVDTVVVHQNFELDIEVHINQLVCKKATPMLSSRPVFPFLLVTYPTKEGVRTLLVASTKYGGERQCNRMLDRFEKALHELETHLDDELGCVPLSPRLNSSLNQDALNQDAALSTIDHSDAISTSTLKCK